MDVLYDEEQQKIAEMLHEPKETNQSSQIQEMKKKKVMILELKKRKRMLTMQM
jgi:hypothetical protein